MKCNLFSKYVQFIDCLQIEATMYCCPLHAQCSASLSARCRRSSSVISDLALLSRVSARSTRRHFESESLTLHPL